MQGPPADPNALVGKPHVLKWSAQPLSPKKPEQLATTRPEAIPPSTQAGRLEIPSAPKWYARLRQADDFRLAYMRVYYAATLPQSVVPIERVAGWFKVPAPVILQLCQEKIFERKEGMIVLASVLKAIGIEKK